MNRQIKFRGRFIGEDGHNSYIGEKKVGDWIYGGYMRSDLNFVDGEGDFIVTGGGHAYRVDSNSVAQLVGYDANGKEVYEGDTVIRYDSKEEFEEAPENGKLREVILYTQVVPLDDGYYCLLKGGDQ